MKREKRSLLAAVCLAAVYVLLSQAQAWSTVLQVGPDWSGTPYTTIQDAVTAATDGDEVWVEQGTYALTAMINVNKKVSIYGGFTGSETSRDQRNWTTNVTTVDGQNSVGCFYTTADATIDGFTITRGYKVGSGELDKGAGILNGDPALGSPPADAPDLTVANCIFSHNESYLRSGGAICNYLSSGNLTINACTFEDNYGDEKGGAIRVQKGNAIIEDCTFTNNKIKKDTGGVGGAIEISNTAGTASIARCTFTGNKCRDGGALGADVQATITRCVFANNNPVIAAPRYGTITSYGDLPLTITNCLFYGNRVQYGGGIAIGTGTNENLNVMNCTFADNVLVGTGATGGSIHSRKTGGTAFNVTNCILWGNAANKEVGGATGYLAPTVSYSDIDNSTVYAGTGNINTNPSFVGSGNYSLQATSPCIDAGTSNGAPATDIAGTSRPQGEGYDMGAYELPFIDADGDGIADGLDNCPNNYNPQQLDADTDRIGDVCDSAPGCGGCGGTACEYYSDSDNDGIPDVIDNCPTICNSSQLDADTDGIGDVCDTTPGCGGCGLTLCETVCSL